MHRQVCPKGTASARISLVFSQIDRSFLGAAFQRGDRGLLLGSRDGLIWTRLRATKRIVRNLVTAAARVAYRVRLFAEYR